MRTTHLAIIAAIACATTVIGCDAEPVLDDQRSPLLGDINYGGTCTAAMRTFQEKLTRYGRTAAVSRAFRECLTEAITTGVTGLTYGGSTGPYRKCTGDPWYHESLQTQIDKIVDMSLSLNDLHVNCTGGLGNASVAGADQHGYGHSEDETFSWAAWFSNVLGEIGQPLCTPTSAASCRYLPYPWPYDQAAGITWHEASHTHGYTHGANDQAAAKVACGYGTDATWHFQRNTMPYIVGDCMEEVLARSGDRCGGHVEDDLECGPTMLHLIDGFNSTSCSCVQDPQASASRFQIEVRDAGNELVDRTACEPATLAVRVLPLTGTCATADLQLTRNGAMLTSAHVAPYTWHSFDVSALSGQIDIRATCGVTIVRRVHVDRDAPSVSSVSVSSNGWARNPVRITLAGVSDDGWWLTREYRTSVYLDGVLQGQFAGIGASLTTVSEGEHTVHVHLVDACGHQSAGRDRTFNVDRTAPTVSFVRPTAGAMALLGSNLTVEVIAGDPAGFPINTSRVSGLSSVKIYLDSLPAEVGGGQLLCTMSGPWMIGYASGASCTVPVSFSTGTHQLIAVATDRAGNQTTAQRAVLVTGLVYGGM